MEKINTINLPRFRNSEHFQFMTDTDVLIAKHQPGELAIDDLYPVFKTSLDAEAEVIRVESGSILSQSLQELDMLRDSTWSAISARAKATLLSPFEEETESAGIVLRIIGQYGEVRSISYNEESASLSNLTTDLLQPDNAAHLKNAGINRWVPELKSQNEQFQALFNQRDTELSDRESGDMRAVRALIDPVYEQMVERINASVVMKIAKPAASKFIDELNVKIEYYKTTLAARMGRAQAVAKAKPAAEKGLPG